VLDQPHVLALDVRNFERRERHQQGSCRENPPGVKLHMTRGTVEKRHRSSAATTSESLTSVFRAKSLASRLTCRTTRSAHPFARLPTCASTCDRLAAA
jgi:hypothetical protein